MRKLLILFIAILLPLLALDMRADKPVNETYNTGYIEAMMIPRYE